MGRAKSLRRWEWMTYGQKVEQCNRRGERRKVCMQMMPIQRFSGRKLRVFSSSSSVMEFLMKVITRKQILPMAVPFCYDYSHAIFRFTV